MDKSIEQRIEVLEKEVAELKATLKEFENFYELLRNIKR